MTWLVHPRRPWRRPFKLLNVVFGPWEIGSGSRRRVGWLLVWGKHAWFFAPKKVKAATD